MLNLSSNLSSNQPTSQSKSPKRRRRKGKGARARERRDQVAAGKASAETALMKAKADLEKEKANLFLKNGDKVKTFPSNKYPESAILTVRNITWNPNREDWMISFEESTVAIGHAWYDNYDRTYCKPEDYEQILEAQRKIEEDAVWGGW
jgi:hypothetical protein